MNVEFHILDVFDTVSPNLIKFKNYEQAKNACAKLQKISGNQEIESKELSDLRIQKVDETSPIAGEETKDDQRSKIKESKKFDDEFQEMMKESIKEVTETGPRPKREVVLPRKVLKESDSLKPDEPSSKSSTNEKKITLLVRQSDKLLVKNVVIKKDSELAKKIISKELDELETREMALASTQKLHNESVRTVEANGANINVGNDQIFIKMTKK